MPEWRHIAVAHLIYEQIAPSEGLLSQIVRKGNRTGIFLYDEERKKYILCFSNFCLNLEIDV